MYAELDEWNARIAELSATADETDELKSAAKDAQAQATESYTAAHREPSLAEAFAPSAELRTLFRRVAECVHPDMAASEGDRAIRERLMASANIAYRRGEMKISKQYWKITQTA